MEGEKAKQSGVGQRTQPENAKKEKKELEEE